jgi:hypothetical protein
MERGHQRGASGIDCVVIWKRLGVDGRNQALQ